MRHEDPEAHRARQKRYYEEHSAERIAYQKRYYEEHRIEEIARAIRWKEENPERARAHSAVRANERLARLRLWDSEHPEAHNDRRRAWAAANVVRLAGERVAITRLPEEFRPVARLIKETRREILRRAK
jgi:hypothetical protein